jgi:hypothetical protein
MTKDTQPEIRSMPRNIERAGRIIGAGVIAAGGFGAPEVHAYQPAPEFPHFKEITLGTSDVNLLKTELMRRKGISSAQVEADVLPNLVVMPFSLKEFSRFVASLEQGSDLQKACQKWMNILVAQRVDSPQLTGAQRFAQIDGETSYPSTQEKIILPAEVEVTVDFPAGKVYVGLKTKDGFISDNGDGIQKVELPRFSDVSLEPVSTATLLTVSGPDRESRNQDFRVQAGDLATLVVKKGPNIIGLVNTSGEVVDLPNPIAGAEVIPALQTEIPGLFNQELSPSDKLAIAAAGGQEALNTIRQENKSDFAVQVRLEKNTANGEWQLPSSVANLWKDTDFITYVNGLILTKQELFKNLPKDFTPVLIPAVYAKMEYGVKNAHVAFAYKVIDQAGKLVEVGGNSLEEPISALVSPELRPYVDELVIQVDDNLRNFAKQFGLEITGDVAVLVVLKDKGLPVSIANGNQGIVLNYPQVVEAIKDLNKSLPAGAQLPPTPTPVGPQVALRSDNAKYVEKDTELVSQFQLELNNLGSHIKEEKSDIIQTEISDRIRPVRSKYGLLEIVATKKYSDSRPNERSGEFLFDQKVVDRTEIVMITGWVRQLPGRENVTVEQVEADTSTYINLVRSSKIQFKSKEFDTFVEGKFDVKTLKRVTLVLSPIAGRGGWYEAQTGSTFGTLFNNQSGQLYEIFDKLPYNFTQQPTALAPEYSTVALNNVFFDASVAVSLVLNITGSATEKDRLTYSNTMYNYIFKDYSKK